MVANSVYLLHTIGGKKFSNANVHNLFYIFHIKKWGSESLWDLDTELHPHLTHAMLSPES